MTLMCLDIFKVHSLTKQYNLITNEIVCVLVIIVMIVNNVNCQSGSRKFLLDSSLRMQCLD